MTLTKNEMELIDYVRRDSICPACLVIVIETLLELHKEMKPIKKRGEAAKRRRLVEIHKKNH